MNCHQKCRPPQPTLVVFVFLSATFSQSPHRPHQLSATPPLRSPCATTRHPFDPHAPPLAVRAPSRQSPVPTPPSPSPQIFGDGIARPTDGSQRPNPGSSSAPSPPDPNLSRWRRWRTPMWRRWTSTSTTTTSWTKGRGFREDPNSSAPYDSSFAAGGRADTDSVGGSDPVQCTLLCLLVL
jgi:hypothetical protein